MTVKVLPQWHAGVQFRSTLEARWAIFFDHAGIGWEYEPEGFVIDGHPYRPDFLLDCGTWAEVKGDPERLDLDLMLAAARDLPGQEWRDGDGVIPKLLILGPIPRLSPVFGGPGWLGLEHYPGWADTRVGYFGFGAYRGTRRLTDLETIIPEAASRLYDQGLDAFVDGDEAAAKEIWEDANSTYRSLKNYGDSYFFLTPKPFPEEPALAAYDVARARRFGRP